MVSVIAMSVIAVVVIVAVVMAVVMAVVLIIRRGRSFFVVVVRVMVMVMRWYDEHTRVGS